LAYRALGMSLRGGCEAAIATTEGIPIGPNFNPGRGGHGMNLLDWRYELRHRPGAAATISGRARGLRQKIKKLRNDAVAARWLGLMRLAFLTAWQTAPLDYKTADAEIMRLAAEAGETEYAADKLMTLARVARADAEAARLLRMEPAEKRSQGISHPNSRD
jgi:hypothetical protein